jgi:hypothetical protein
MVSSMPLNRCAVRQEPQQYHTCSATCWRIALWDRGLARGCSKSGLTSCPRPWSSPMARARTSHAGTWRYQNPLIRDSVYAFPFSEPIGNEPARRKLEHGDGLPRERNRRGRIRDHELPLSPPGLIQQVIKEDLVGNEHQTCGAWWQSDSSKLAEPTGFEPAVTCKQAQFGNPYPKRLRDPSS